MTYIDQLNRKLGEALGYTCSGTVPRFAWKYAPTLPLWRTRLGKVWVLCQWRRPVVSEQEWKLLFDGAHVYPAAGLYEAHTETALEYGIEPTEALTQTYIHAIDRQMSTSYANQLLSGQDELDRNEADDYTRWVELVQDSCPAYGNFAPGTRGGHVSYGGMYAS